MELVGYVKANIWVSSTAEDQDFFAFLEDIDGTGKATVITQFQLRASHRALSKPFFNNLGLPWRANPESEAAPLLPEQPVELVLDPMPVSYIVKAYHHIRMTITNANPSAGFLRSANATVSIYRDAQHASHISLPVIADPIKVEVRSETPNLKGNDLILLIIPPPALGKGYRAEDIDISSLRCNGAIVESAHVKNNTLVAKFKIQDLVDASKGSAVELSVTGRFRFEISFAGNKTVRAIGTPK
jgi:hypothetical protein